MRSVFLLVLFLVAVSCGKDPAKITAEAPAAVNSEATPLAEIKYPGCSSDSAANCSTPCQAERVSRSGEYQACMSSAGRPTEIEGCRVRDLNIYRDCTTRKCDEMCAGIGVDPLSASGAECRVYCKSH